MLLPCGSDGESNGGGLLQAAGESPAVTHVLSQSPICYDHWTWYNNQAIPDAVPWLYNYIIIHTNVLMASMALTHAASESPAAWIHIII